MRNSIAAAACLLALVACGNPKDPEGWAKRAASRSRLDEKLEALAQVRKAPGDRHAAVPHLVKVLEQMPHARAEAAVALGEIGDPAAVRPLIEALDVGARDRDTMDANRRIADALGALRAREAREKLEQLIGSPDGYSQVAAVDALGRIGDPAAVGKLIEVATGERVEPFTARKALLALGRIGDARAGPAVLRMLFEERAPGISFFAEASFAAAQIGRPMAAPLLAVLQGKDDALAGWAKQHGVVQGALYAKSAQVLGDVGGPEAVPALVSKLSYREGDPGIATYVRVIAAESLGRMRARDGMRPLADLVSREKDANVRDRYCDALVRIGDPAAIPALKAASASGAWDLREGPLTAISRLGSEPERPFVEAAQAKDCKPRCEPAVEAAYAAMLARLDAAKECRADANCWGRKLSDERASVRDRAALEIGRGGGAAHASALSEALMRPVKSDVELPARYHAVLALGWIASREKIGADAESIAANIDALIAQDRGRTLTAGVNEDALRLATRLRRDAGSR